MVTSLSYHSLPPSLKSEINQLTYSGQLNRDLLFRCMNYFTETNTKVIVIHLTTHKNQDSISGFGFGQSKWFKGPIPSILKAFLKLTKTTDKTLEYLASRGVLFLNLQLANFGRKGSLNAEWEQQVAEFIKYLDSKCRNKVYMLLGSEASRLLSIIDSDYNLVIPFDLPLKPTPDVWDQINDYLVRRGRGCIT